MKGGANYRGRCRATRMVLAISVVCCAAAGALRAQAAPASSPSRAEPKTAPQPASAAIPAYPDTAKGLEEFVNAMMKAEKNGDRQTLGAYARSLVLRNPLQWFDSAFGDDAGPQLAAASENARNGIEFNAPGTIRDMIASKRTTVGVARFDGSCTNDRISFGPTDTEYKLLVLRENPQPLYDVRFTGSTSWSLWTYFAYVNGGFRYVGQLQASDVRAHPPVTPPESVVAGSLVKRVAPKYPDFARQSGVQGEVMFHALIGTDGTIHSLELVAGPCALVEAAETAVKQWRFSPATQDGKPVQVDTVITVSFTLGSL